MAHLQQTDGIWRVRWWESTIRPDGTRKLSHRSKALGRFRTKQAALRAAEKFTARIAGQKRVRLSSTLLPDFIAFGYLEHAKSRLRASTLHGYTRLYNDYRAFWPEIYIEDFRTVDGERLLEKIHTRHNLSRNTLRNIKCFLSGVFKHAKRIGLIDHNPMQDVSLPRCRPPKPTEAYGLEEVTVMLHRLPARAAAVVAVAAFTGLRKSEIAALKWEDYQGGQILVSRARWRTVLDEPKTLKSAAPVPVIPVLANVLDLWRRQQGNATAGWMFGTRPLYLDTFDDREIKPYIARWRGWHAFRRGLSTNLKHLGVADTTIQAILRHSSVRTTQQHYIKTLPEDTVEAMKKLEKAVRTMQR